MENNSVQVYTKIRENLFHFENLTGGIDRGLGHSCLFAETIYRLNQTGADLIFFPLLS